MTSGEDVQSRNVILAMGAYFNISGVLTPFTSREMDLKLTSQTIAYIRVSAKEAKVWGWVIDKRRNLRSYVAEAFKDANLSNYLSQWKA